MRSTDGFHRAPYFPTKPMMSDPTITTICAPPHWWHVANVHVDSSGRDDATYYYYYLQRTHREGIITYKCISHPSRCSRRFWSIIGWDSSVSLEVQLVTCWHLLGFLYEIGYVFVTSSKTIGDFPGVLSFNWCWECVNNTFVVVLLHAFWVMFFCTMCIYTTCCFSNSTGSFVTSLDSLISVGGRLAWTTLTV